MNIDGCYELCKGFSVFESDDQSQIKFVNNILTWCQKSDKYELPSNGINLEYADIGNVAGQLIIEDVLGGVISLPSPIIALQFTLKDDSIEMPMVIFAKQNASNIHIVTATKDQGGWGFVDRLTFVMSRTSPNSEIVLHENSIANTVLNDSLSIRTLIEKLHNISCLNILSFLVGLKLGVIVLEESNIPGYKKVVKSI